MIPTHFDYRAPGDAAQAAELLGADPEGSRLLGGGTWVVPELSSGESSPRTIVDLRQAGLRAIAPTADGVRIGAMATYADLLASPAVAEHAPLLTVVAGGITGGWAIRGQGTIGGAVAAARPASDLPAALIAAAAIAVIRGREGERRIPVARLITGAGATTLAGDELLCAFEVPAVSADGFGYIKLKRGASSWPIVTAAACARRDGDVCTEIRLVLGGAAATPLVVDVGESLVGAAVTPAMLAAAARLAGEAVVDPWEDALASGDYRLAVAEPVARRALAMAFGLAAGDHR